MIVMTFGVQVH